MPRPKKIKSPEDFGKEFEKLKKPRKPEKKEPLIHEGFGVPMKEVIEKFAESHESKELTPLEELQELEKKLRACTDETPRDIRYRFDNEVVELSIAYNNYVVRARFYRGASTEIKESFIDTNKTYLLTAQKMLDVLKEWRGE